MIILTIVKNVVFAEYTEIALFIVMFVEFVWMFSFVETTNVVQALRMTNVAFVWRTHSRDARSYLVLTKYTKNARRK